MLEYKLWLSIATMRYKTKNQLLNYYGDINSLWSNYHNGNLKREFGDLINSKLKKALDLDKLKELKNYINREGINICTIQDSYYPKKLKVYSDSPYLLYYKGSIEKLNNPSVSIVGSRKSDFYGENVTKKIATSLAMNKINVISGMAKGIDTYAHVYALKNNGFTTAVLGSGVDVIYPKHNMNLYYNLCNEGCVISEFPPHTKPLHYNFPIRNRIISGLSDLVIVVEASIKSGSLITANAALDQGKDVMAVPGDISNSINEGSNKLIKDGAYIYTEIDDIYEILRIERKDNCDKDSVKLKNNEKLVFNKINNKPIHIDFLLNNLKIDIGTLYQVLFELEAKNLIKHLAGDFYVRYGDIK